MVRCHGVSRIARCGLALGLALAALAVLAGDSLAKSKRLRPPASVSLHPDRGMTFGRYSKTSHDPRIFAPLNQGTRLPGMDPAIDPYNLHSRTSVYDPHTGVIRGSLNDAALSIRRAQKASRRAARDASRRAASESTATTDRSSD